MLKLQLSREMKEVLLDAGKRGALEVCSLGTRCVDFVLERHLVQGPGAFQCTSGANLVQNCKTLWLSSKALRECIPYVSSAFYW